MKIITGSLLDIREGVVLHQVNCIGATGGLAGALRRKWPNAFDGYLRVCGLHRACDLYALGCFALGDSGTGVRIGHVFGQHTPGPHTEMMAVRMSLATAAICLHEWQPHETPIYAPYHMGCGLGGGNWDEYLPALVEAFPDIIIVRREGD